MTTITTCDQMKSQREEARSRLDIDEIVSRPISPEVAGRLIESLLR
jgi:hypothetical protein